MMPRQRAMSAWSRSPMPSGVLTAGSMPMTVLEKHVDYEIAQALAKGGK
jgi:uncharacterized protein (DUF885 family)